MSEIGTPGWLGQLRERGVIRVAASYAVIGWLLLQIADVTFEPLGLPGWVMPALIVAVVLGFPVAVLLAWFFELGDHGVTRDSAPAAATRPQVHGLRRYADVLIIGVLLITVAVLLVRESDLGKPPPPAKPTLAVLPFANLSADPEQQYFSDGLAEEVLDKLGQVPGLTVVASSSSFSFRDAKQDVRTIAEKLGVNVVLEGAVRRDGRRLRLNAKLVDGGSGHQLWSGSFDREVNDVFAVQSELAQAVIDAIVPVARGDVRVDALHAPPPTTSLTAYDLYLLGRAQAGLRWERELLRSVELFGQALEQDPNFAKAQAALAASLVLLIDYEVPEPTLSRGERVERAEAAVYRALALDPKLAEAHVAHGNLLRHTGRDGAAEAYRRALELNPNSAEAWHNYAVFLSWHGKTSPESQAASRRAHELDPLAIIPWVNYTRLVLRPGAEAFRSELQKAATTFADNPLALRQFGRIAVMSGYPHDGWKFVVASRRAAAVGLPRDLDEIGALWPWLFVDPQYSVTQGERLLEDPELAQWAWFPLVPANGRLGNEAAVFDLLDRHVRTGGPEDRQVDEMRAFWLAVFGRYPEAARAFERAQPIPDGGNDAGAAITIAPQQAVPAMLRVYRGTGRAAEAAGLARDSLSRYRAEQPRQPDEQRYNHWVRDAALAANEGLREEAVRYLRNALSWEDVPVGYAPELPWFRSLEGYGPYDALRREHASRVARAREAMLALNATLPPKRR